MGKIFSKEPSNTFIIERMITPDIYIGIQAGGNQSLRYNSVYYKLISCQEYDNKIIYEFENQVFLEFSKGYDEVIQYTLTTPNEIHIGQITEIIRKTYKDINMDSKELDKIVRLFQ